MADVPQAGAWRAPATPAARAGGWRALHALLCAAALATIWLAPHLPHADLPQHAGQIALLRGLLAGSTPWAPELRLNWATPYLVGYLPLLGLSYLVSIESAIAIVYSATFLAFVAACAALRRELGGDERLDWLALPSFFGLAWHWGFLTFLAAVPIGLAFIVASCRFAARATPAGAFALLGLGAGLLVAHGMVFAYAVPVGLVIVAIGGSWRGLLRRAWPHLALLAGFALYKALVLDPEMAQAPNAGLVMWGPAVNRVRALTIHPTTGVLRSFWFAPLVTLLGFAAPWLLGLRPSPGWRARIPFLWTLAMMLAYPAYVSGATNFYDRFALLLLPTYAVMFARARAGGRLRRVPPQAVMAALAGAAALVVGREAVHNAAFAREVRPVDALLARLPPSQRVLYVPLDTESAAAGWHAPYVHYPLWYQALHGGLVEFNFATFSPQVVRFRDFRRHVEPEASWQPQQRLRWSRFEREPYAWVLVRSPGLPGPQQIGSDACPLVLADSAPGGWWAYRNPCVP